MTKALWKDTVKEITKNFKRFISILLIVLLGVGFFVGIKAASPDMKKTIDQYFDMQKVMDMQIISTLGITKEDIQKLKSIESVEEVEASYTADVMVKTEEKESVVKLETMPQNLNKLTLLEGKMPENLAEVVVEKIFLSGTNYQIGDEIEIQAQEVQNSKGEKQNLLKQNKVTIVGTVESPLYISRDRGSTKLGSRKNKLLYVYTI